MVYVMDWFADGQCRALFVHQSHTAVNSITISSHCDPALSPPALLSNILMLVATSQFWLLTVLFSKTIGLIVNSQFLFSHFWKLYQHFVSLLTDSLYRKIFFLAAFHCIKNCLIVNSLCTGKYFYNTFYILFYILLWKESSLKLNITNIQWL